MISILMASRRGGNENSDIFKCIDSFAKNAESKNNYEFLIKLDDDDVYLDFLEEVCANFQNKINLSYIVTSRSSGYADLHKAYLDLFKKIDYKSKMIWVVSDDIEISTNYWDSKILASVKNKSDSMFTINTLHFLDYKKKSVLDSVEGPDPYPIWGLDWIGVQGGFGYTFSTDGWTSLILHRLINIHDFDPRIFVPLNINRRICEEDLEGSDRWVGIRADTHQFLLSEHGIRLITYATNNILNYKLIRSELSRKSIFSNIYKRFRNKFNWSKNA